jgi:hypothetical protein
MAPRKRLGDLPFERVFSMAAFEGLRTVRAQHKHFLIKDVSAVVDLLKKIEADIGNLDFEAALQLAPLIDPTTPHDQPQVFYRVCIAEVLIAQGKPWNKLVTLGREHLLDGLSRDQHQCFRSANLIENALTDDVVEWWDELSGRVRAIGNEQKHIQSRKAEKLTVLHEINRLKTLGIAKEPAWVAIEDNTLGYDVLSFDPGVLAPVGRMIEVKSTTVSPLRFYVTRNEWEQALKLGASYHFHVWDMSVTPARLYELTADQVRPHIPADQSSGKWSNAEILVSAALKA